MSTFALDNLSDAELDELSSSLAFTYLSRSGTRYSRAEIDLWATIGAIFPPFVRMPLDHFVRGVDGGGGFGVARYALCSQILDSTVTKACEVGARKATRMAMRRFLLECLRDWLISGNIPPSPKALLQNINNLEHAANQAYPGYIAAGMLGFVLDPLPVSK